MPDANHFFGNDLAFSASGDLDLSDGIDLSNQRILRRLMTTNGEYIWHPEYGGSVPLRVGAPGGALGDEDPDDSFAAIDAVVRTQMFLEAAVQRVPEPVITVQPILNGVAVGITYVDALSGDGASLDFDAVI